MEKINICFIVNDKYAWLAGAAIFSIFKNKNKSSKYEIFIISHNINKENKDKLNSLNKNGFKISCVELKEAQKYDQIPITSWHTSKISLFKFDIPAILSDLDKVLYLDADILVQKDLEALYNTNLQENYAAVIRDPLPILRDRKKHAEDLGLESETAYFNSGVMLLNLKKLREENITEKLINYKINKYNYFMDQDAFNAVFRGNVKYISVKYNIFPLFLENFTVEQLEGFYGEKFCKKLSDNCKSAVILHLVGYKKPWSDWINFYHLTYLYFKYLFSSPFRSEGISKLKDIILMKCKIMRILRFITNCR